MTKKIELDPETERLVSTYCEKMHVDFNTLTNKALKYYIVNKLSSKEVRQAKRKMKLTLNLSMTYSKATIVLG
ncbi:hypothetical protein LBJG_00727 [Lactobacillus jensenii 1153]|nr:hypothetical protein LBJG_00727 [Lactobacillus jensenii 1153]